MCTMIVFRGSAGTAYAGRNLDLDARFGENVVITPRGYSFPLKNGETWRTCQALTGMAACAARFPLYAEAANERGVVMAGLNFPGSAKYHSAAPGKKNITPFELIPWVLGQADSADEAEALLRDVNVLNIPFSEQMPLAPLHFMIGDSRRSFVCEPDSGGLSIYDDPYDVMTNNPPFPFHEWNLRGYRRLSAANGEPRFSRGGTFSLPAYAEGMGSIGLPGDPSSSSRFVRAAFTLANAEKSGSEEENVMQTFHILDSVAMTKGTVVTAGGGTDITCYSSCISLSDGTYYYKTYNNSRITAVPFDEKYRDSDSLTIFPLRTSPDILRETKPGGSSAVCARQESCAQRR